MKSFRRQIVTAFFALLTLLMPFFAATAYGQQGGPGNGFRVSPPRYDVSVAPGKSKTVGIFVENLSNSTVVAQPVVNDFVASSSEDGQPRLIIDTNEKAPTNSFKDIVSPIADTTLKPLERKEIKVTIAPAANASPGGYYGAVRFTPVSTTGGQSNVALTASVGTLFLVKVTGNITEKMELQSFTASKNGKPGSFFSSGPITLITRLKNTGNIHVQPFGKIIVKNMWGKEVFQSEINNTEPRGNVLPGSIRRFETPITVKHMFGKYTATGNFSYGTNGDLITAKTTFYVIPYQLIIGIILLLLFLIFVLPRMIKAYNRRIIAKSKKHNQ